MITVQAIHKSLKSLKKYPTPTTKSMPITYEQLMQFAAVTRLVVPHISISTLKCFNKWWLNATLKNQLFEENKNYTQYSSDREYACHGAQAHATYGENYSHTRILCHHIQDHREYNIKHSAAYYHGIARFPTAESVRSGSSQQGTELTHKVECVEQDKITFFWAFAHQIPLNVRKLEAFKQLDIKRTKKY